MVSTADGWTAMHAEAAVKVSHSTFLVHQDALLERVSAARTR
jgi:hypothetical protein